MAEPISIEKQFENYLVRVKLDKNKVSKAQYDETKKTFFDGASAMLVLFSETIPDLSENHAVIEVENLIHEAQFFWRIQLM